MIKAQLIALLFVANVAAGQFHDPDSLELRLNDPISDQEKVEILCLLMDEMENQVRHEKVIYYANQVDSLANKIGDMDAVSKAHIHKSYSYSKQYKLESAIIEAKKALDIRLEMEADPSKIAACYISLGNTYQRKSMLPEGLESYQKAMDVLLKDGQEDEVITPMMNAGAMYLDLNDMKNARKYYFDAFALAEKNKIDGRDRADLLNGIGNLYFQESKYDTMMDYYQEALKLFLECNYKTGIANTYNNVAIGYFYLDQPEMALDYFTRALQVRQLSKDSIGISQSLNNIGLYHQGMGDQETAIGFFEQAMELAIQINATSEQYDAAEALYETYQTLEDYEQALAFRDCTFVLKEQMLANNHRRNVEDLEVKYGAKRKDEEINRINALREKEAELKAEEEFANNLTIVSVSSIALILAILGIVLLSGNKRKRKANILLKRQKQEIEENRDQIEQQNTDITDSIRYAKKIQQAILPDLDDLSAMGDYFLLYQPRDIVSGDFYWYYRRGEDHFVAIADCTGHGVPGAFVSMLCHNALSEVVIERSVSDPGRALSEVNKEIVQRLNAKGSEAKVNDGMDVILCRFNKEKRELRFAGANNSLFYLKNGELNEVSVDRESIGGNSGFDYEFETKSLDMDGGEVIYLRTDGYQDQFGGLKGKKYMKKRLVNFLKEIGGKPLPEQQKLLQDNLNAWKLDYDQVDDITLFGLRVD